MAWYNYSCIQVSNINSLSYKLHKNSFKNDIMIFKKKFLLFIKTTDIS